MLLHLHATQLLNAWDQWQRIEDERDSPCSDVRRIRLSGAPSCEYMLKCANLFTGTRTLDLKDCSTLTEDILKAISVLNPRLQLVCLIGTKIPFTVPWLHSPIFDVALHGFRPTYLDLHNESGLESLG